MSEVNLQAKGKLSKFDREVRRIVAKIEESIKASKEATTKEQETNATIG